MPDTSDCLNACCGACSRAYVFNACCVGAQPVYVCSDAVCNGTPIADILRIVVGSQCYSRAANIPTVAVTPELVLTDGPDIDACDHGGCESPECVDYCGNRFIPGQLCPGQDYSGPPVFVFVDGPQSCGVLPVSSGGGPNVCFKFDPSGTVPQSEVPSGAITLDPSVLWGPQNPNCCVCVPTCAETIGMVTECSLQGPTEVERRCCCTNRRDVTINSASFVEYNPAISFVLRRTITFQTFVQYDGGGIEINRVNTLASVHEENADGSTSDFTLSWTPGGGCLPIAPNPYVGFDPFPWVTDCTFTLDDGSNTAQTLTNIVRTCTNGLHEGTWSLQRNAGIPGDPLSGQVLASGNYTSSIAVTFFGLCSGGCGGTAGRAGVMAERGSAAGCNGCGGGSAMREVLP